MKTIFLSMTLTGAAFAQVEKPHRNSYQEAIALNFGFTCQNCGAKAFPALPANKRLVLEQVSVDINVPANGEYQCQIGPPGGLFLRLETPRKQRA
jgi:hypothetical protein